MSAGCIQSGEPGHQGLAALGHQVQAPLINEAPQLGLYI